MYFVVVIVGTTMAVTVEQLPSFGAVCLLASILLDRRFCAQTQIVV
jgi:hypothetical protein